MSPAEIGDFPQQLRDTMEFLERHEDEVSRLVGTPGVVEAVLDFGLSWQSETVTQTAHLPRELIRLAGGLGLGIELSHYPIAEPTDASGELRPGERVVLTELPPGLLGGLPRKDQEAISAIVGKPVLFLGWDEHGRAELEFTDREGGIHSIYVNPSVVRPAD